MSDQTYQTIAVTLYFAAMLYIGWSAYRKTRDNLDDYMLAGRGLKPWVAALSAGASDMSGWLLMGLPGAIYAKGLVESWIAIGLTIGAWLNWKFVAPRLRSYTEVAGNSITIPSFLEHRLRDRSRSLRIVCGLIILVFFTFYVSSGMVAAGKFFDSTFGVQYIHGMLIVAVVTMVYTLFGGFLGATLTDVAQGLLMLAALVAVPIVALIEVGGPAVTVDTVNSVNPTFFSLFAGGTALGIVSAAAWGLGYFGQPHIIVRFMALRSPQEATTARRFGISWMVATALGAISTAFIGIAYFALHPEKAPKDPETVFLVLAQILFHPFVAGLVLAAVLAAIMSTVSSQLVVCSSALVEDLFKIFAEKSGRDAQISDKTYVRLGRLGVLVVAVIAVLLAIDPSDSILELVGFAWAGFGSSFGPVVILALFWRKLTAPGALAGLIVGAVVAFVWGQWPPFELYEIVPGFAANLVVAIGVSLATYKPDDAVDAEFDEAARLAEKQPT
ncbi:MULTISPECIES: sodium/proline symporter PutP [Tsukamurella]|uniref:Sodium/proline symporter n=2 Tax=Tsukamurella TaxID=2060 RepID=A0A5C5RY96_9ACTN|nr:MULTISPECIES: sodium/proline symporter PutP [Tsukamurella]NMD55501.1 sodium/proline symporter PutP [Tsukamurella columbiensis]TWS28066.1 sodium/proline symporter PutP [Tsukamurella conjunctivitidis]